MWEFGPCEPRLIPLIGIGGQPHRRLSDPRPAHKLSAPGLTRGVLNLNTCYLPGVFEPQDYQAETRNINGSNGYVFVAGIK